MEIKFSYLGKTQNFMNDFNFFICSKNVMNNVNEQGGSTSFKLKQFHKFKTLINKIKNLEPNINHDIGMDKFQIKTIS